MPHRKVTGNAFCLLLPPTCQRWTHTLCRWMWTVGMKSIDVIHLDQLEDQTEYPDKISSVCLPVTKQSWCLSFGAANSKQNGQPHFYTDLHTLCQSGKYRSLQAISGQWSYTAWCIVLGAHIAHGDSFDIIQHLASSRQFGFMPETDSAEMWLLIQSMVEVACLENIPLHGYVTDIQKAFENLPRTPIKAIATQLRASSQILDLWFSFLENMCRRFVILSQVGEGLRSNHGFPEGCALSCYAMALVDISFHCYFRVYSSRSLELSYVDNMEIITFAEAQLQQGITCLRAWLDAWGLHLDEAKSYIWSTAPASRRLLSLLGWKVVLVEKDLGAPMSYGKRSSSSISTSRIATLAQLWPRLTRSLAPTWQKEKALKMAFWPRAFYGSANGKVAPEQIRQLRTEAMRALGHRRAGASPAARLFLLCDPLCDPGFYHAWHVVITFRRVACKRPVLVDLWRDFMDGFGGSPSYGPLSKLLDILGQVGWQMEVPHIGTHDGIWFDFVATPTQILYDHFVDAWAQQVSYDLAKRKDFGISLSFDFGISCQHNTKFTFFLFGTHGGQLFTDRYSFLTGTYPRVFQVLRTTWSKFTSLWMDLAGALHFQKSL